ncbi:uncharacterized protein LOC111680077 [Lucilia cuprina]|uniref:uncharacterized protein LOC111680077 n=1 Tax=Lucilia cuprina TaxID=7375 RepID=UPI001F067FF0|nr:uncharacterized protein LOC111680077 [Lucilia cuprina]XP_046811009.1 uncharacterized protein LOC111680077 [Lucilia cuprina]XP_046811010.1 uncharacterized protein LOC111680077 [Lucilia cuprina]XP_046811011.1 uncharacterized protein LOC111680077 [Lucilia cuprina]XP_046811012.1 uncharacterized protein LOC111680077 [Lucilia cuprina]XP_046811013.1 uncharacterized protein LOC111680077 [Lucilia cuprina]
MKSLLKRAFPKHNITMSQKKSVESHPNEEIVEKIPNDSEDLNYFKILPVEILHKIFNLCELRDQLILAKVSKHCRDIIAAIYKTKYKFMYCNYFKDYSKLKDQELIEFFRLCGDFVECLHLVTHFSSRFCGEDPKIYENYLHFHKLFTHCIRYFKNLCELKIYGNAFPDSTILELAKHCKKLKSITFTTMENGLFQGKHLHQLEAIENLNLKFCHRLDPKHLLAVSQKRHLKMLNLLGCYRLSEMSPILQLCNHWRYLETLVLFAITSDKQFLKAIIDLPSLKSLQFNWVDISPVRPVLNFEENFFLTLSEHQYKSEKLKYIKFTNEQTYSHCMIEKCSQKEYAKMKESLHARLPFEHWSMEKFNLISLTLKSFKNLHTINFHYWRPLSNEQLINLVKMNSNLQFIKIDGCPEAGDIDLKNQWMDPKCKLQLESILTLDEVKNIYDNVVKRTDHAGRERSICCHFE